jgi:hypothetical protein
MQVSYGGDLLLAPACLRAAACVVQSPSSTELSVACISSARLSASASAFAQLLLLLQRTLSTSTLAFTSTGKSWPPSRSNRSSSLSRGARPIQMTLLPIARCQVLLLSAFPHRSLLAVSHRQQGHSSLEAWATIMNSPASLH